MAKTKKKESEGLDLIENPDAIVSKTEEFFNDKKNQNTVFGIVGVIAVILLAYLGYNYYISSRNTEAQEEMFQAVYYFEADSLGKALNGDGNNYGFLDITDLYSGTKAANLSSRPSPFPRTTTTSSPSSTNSTKEPLSATMVSTTAEGN